MVKCTKQDMGNQKSDGEGHKSDGTGKRVSGTWKIILPLQKMQGRLLKGKGKMDNVPKSSEKKVTSKDKMIKGKKKVTSKGQGKRMKMGSKKMSFPSKGKGKPRSKVPKSKVPDSKVPDQNKPRSKVRRSKVPESKVPDQKSIIYARVSSSKQVDKAGFKRQQERRAAKAGNADTVKEVVSGSLPATQRTQLVDILKNNCGKKVYIENPRALARSTVAGEQLYEMSKENNVQIVSVDMPELFDHQPSAGTAFLRRVMLVRA